MCRGGGGGTSFLTCSSGAGFVVHKQLQGCRRLAVHEQD